MRDVDVARAMRVTELRRARAELGAARDRYEAARRRLAVFESALLRGAADEREAALAAFRSGELSLLELIDFERALSRAEIIRLQTLIEAADAFAALQGVSP
jgi:cobalt-zinc-cadmium efflux system outer membrane protein